MWDIGNLAEMNKRHAEYAKTVKRQEHIMDLIFKYESGELNDEQIVALFQELVDSGLAWKLQGSYGRMAQQMIDAGYVSQEKREGVRSEVKD